MGRGLHIALQGAYLRHRQGCKLSDDETINVRLVQYILRRVGDADHELAIAVAICVVKR